MSQLSSPEPEIVGANIEQREVQGLSQGQIVRKRFRHHVAAVVSIVVLVLVVVMAFTSVGIAIGDVRIQGWWPYSWDQILPLLDQGRPTLSLIPFNIGQHPFGQDEVGRDIFAVVMRGAQQSLMVMAIVGVVSTALGVVIGAVSGYFRGWTDGVLMRFTDIIITIPVIVIGAVLGNAFGNLGAAVLGVIIGLFAWTAMARLVRGEFLTLREREFVDAARVSGASNSRIIFRHILPNATGVIIVNATLLMAAAILLESALSFIGFGVQSPDTSLGKIVSDNRAAFATRPWLFWWPGFFIIVIALCVNFIGDGLRDAFDPRQKKMPSEKQMARATARAQRGNVAARPDGPDGEDDGLFGAGVGTVTVPGETALTGDARSYHDPRPVSEGDADQDPLDPQR